MPIITVLTLDIMAFRVRRHLDAAEILEALAQSLTEPIHKTLLTILARPLHKMWHHERNSYL